uniref:Cystatin domain-containing protein n=1 Tax=Leersia perrieri TaxID=77586 RepID=A0A0D9VDL1_9ORYZ
MAIRLRLALPLLLALSFSVAGSAAAAKLGGGGGGHGPLVGGWSPIKDVGGDRHVQELGGWAVERHAALASDGLRFRRVVSGEQQVVSGMNYRLVVDAADPKGTTASYVAVIYEQSWTNTRQLTSFDPAPKPH